MYLLLTIKQSADPSTTAQNRMPRPKKVQAKAASKTKIDSARASGCGVSQPITPLADATNRPREPLPTPRAIDFTLALPETGDDGDDGWSSDDSFEEKITWSRHRVRVIPGGFTPRNIQVNLTLKRVS